jgi:hypothetical protein
MASITIPTTIAGSNTILESSGFDGPRARLCGKKNLIEHGSQRFEIDVGDWVSAGSAVLDRVWDPTNLFGRYVLSIEDANAGALAGARLASVDNGSQLNGETLLVTMWVKAIDANTDIDIRIKVGGTPDYMGDNAILMDDWTFIHWTQQVTGTGTTIEFTVYPASDDAADTGKIYMVKPRIYRVFDTITDLPALPLVELEFSPWFWNKPTRNVYGELQYSQRGTIPAAIMNHPAASKTHIDAINAVLNHEAPVLFEPEQTSDVAFMMNREREPWKYQYLSGRALGYEGRTMLTGIEPIYGIPSAKIYIEEEDSYYVVWPNFIRG